MKVSKLTKKIDHFDHSFWNINQIEIERIEKNQKKTNNRHSKLGQSDFKTIRMPINRSVSLYNFWCKVPLLAQTWDYLCFSSFVFFLFLQPLPPSPPPPPPPFISRDINDAMTFALFFALCIFHIHCNLNGNNFYSFDDTTTGGYWWASKTRTIWFSKCFFFLLTIDVFTKIGKNLCHATVTCITVFKNSVW